jgi:HEAT repeat protein
LGTFRESEGDLKAIAAGALYRLGHPGEAAELLPEISADLDKPDGTLRKEAVEQLSRLKAPIALPLLARAARDSNGDVRSEAASALGELDTAEVLPLLEALLRDPLADVRDSAKEAIDDYRARNPK